MEMKELKTRGQIPVEYKWKLEDIYPSDAAWEEEFQRASAEIPGLGELKGTIASSARALAEGLDRIHKISHKIERLYVYARMRRDEDNANPVYQALADRANGLSVRFSAQVSFLNPLLTSLPEETLLAYLQENAGLKDYEFMIRDLIRSKQHVLDEGQEKLLSMSADFSGGAQTIFTMLNNADLQFAPVEHEGKRIPLSHGAYIALMQEPDRALREKVFRTYYRSFEDHINTIAAAYSTNVKKDVFYSKVRGYGDSRERALFGDNVPGAVYDGLIQKVHENLPTMHRFVQLRAKMLGIEDLQMYDIYAPLVDDAKAEYSYEQAVDLVLKGLEPLGEDYLSVLREAFSTGWVDVCETRGKTSGAYSWGVYGVHPYVLLNHRGDLDSVFTIAHEMGHAMHTYYSDGAQPYPLAGYTIFVAEVASTVNEILLTKYLLRTVEDRKLRKYILNHYLDQFRTTVLRQTMFAEFEYKAHQMAERDEPLTPESLSEMYLALNRQYHGPAMGDDATIRYEWARIPHFYNAFYVYKYATGFSCASAIVENLGNPGMLEKYKNFLKSGGSDYPMNLLNKAGVTVEQAVDTCMKEFARALNEFKQLD